MQRGPDAKNPRHDLRRPEPDGGDRKPGDKDKEKDKEKDEEKDLELWRVRTTFKTDDGKTHILAFQAGRRFADLVVRSAPMRVEKLVAFDYVAELDSDAVRASADARNLLDDIEQLIVEFRRKPRHRKRATLAKAYADLGNLVGQLAGHLRIVMEIPDSKKPRWGAMTGEDFGSYMSVSMLTNKHPVGSAPKWKAAATAWRRTLRKRARGGGTYYVQGHLLSEKLGGPGDKKNLTPITGHANTKDHEPNVESKIKRLVHEDAKGVEYSVRAIYGRPSFGAVRRAFYTRRWGHRPRADRNMLLKIVEAEVHVPVALDWKYRVVWDDGVYKKGSFTSGRVQNTIDQSPDSYELR